jgi:fructokinase
VLVVGEALVDIVRDDAGEVVHPGGSPLNVAVGLSRLGLATTLHSSFGADAHGVAIARHLEEAGVSVTPGTVTGDPTSVALATLHPDGSARYTFSVAWDPQRLDPVPTAFQAVHTGSIGAALEPGASAVERLIARMSGTSVVTFDPNIRPDLMGDRAAAVARVERLAALADVVKASDEDIAWLYPDATPAEAMKRWLALGPALVVLTRGAAGADALAASGHQRIPAVAGPVADTIGAGDSFMAGLIAALGDRGLLEVTARARLHELTAEQVDGVVGFAARCAGITVSRPGADPPTRDEVEA